MWTAREQRIFMPVLLGLIGLAWLSLVFWGQSPYGRYLRHDALAEISVGRNGRLLFVFAGGWMLMTIAMMLPTSLPLIARFRQMTATRPDGTNLVGLLIAGYLAVWSTFGVVAHLADLGIHQFVSRLSILERNAWVIGAGALFVAGLYQFTPMKYHCLEACRSPLTFIAGRWRGRNERRQSFMLGVQHGLFCVGCCWSLMVLVFLVGLGNLFWMLMLGSIMAVEKNMSWGRQMSAPLGVSLISAGCAICLLALR